MIYTISKNSFLLLRRDKIFIPALAAIIITIFVADLASDWSIKDLFHSTVNIGVFSFHLIGVFIGTYWGTQLIGRALLDGSIEIEFSGPTPRIKWALGKFLGLVIAMTAIALLFITSWCIILWLSGNFIYFSQNHLLCFFLHYILWIVISSIAFFLSSLTNQAMAIFTTFGLWIAGMISSYIFKAIQNTSDIHIDSSGVEAIAKYWDFQRLNILQTSLESTEILEFGQFAPNITYGLSLIALFVLATCLRVQFMDLN